MPPPAAVVCELCGGKFSKHSLPIHQKACVVKRELSTSFCPVCDCLVSNDEYSAHVGECKKLNGAAAAEIKKANEAKKAKASKEKGKTLGGGAAAAEPAAAAEGEKKPQRSKIPESVLRRLEAFKNGEAELSPDQKLLKELGVEPCLACGKPKAAVACVGCHAVYCKPCSDMIHEVNKALSNHTPVVKAVSGRAPLSHTSRTDAAPLTPTLLTRRSSRRSWRGPWRTTASPAPCASASSTSQRSRATALCARARAEPSPASHSSPRMITA